MSLKKLVCAISLLALISGLSISGSHLLHHGQSVQRADGGGPQPPPPPWPGNQA
jgi:hypothetical protein